MTSSNAKTIKNIIKNTLTSPTTVAAIKKYNLEKFVYSTLPPEKYISGKIRSVEVSIQVLKYNFCSLKRRGYEKILTLMAIYFYNL